jgi:hypothetical protein
MDVPDHEVGVALREAIGAASVPLIDDRLAAAIRGCSPPPRRYPGEIPRLFSPPAPSSARSGLATVQSAPRGGNVGRHAAGRRDCATVRAAHRVRNGGRVRRDHGAPVRLPIVSGSFLLFTPGTFIGGLYAAAHQSYRFAADTASERFRPTAISTVLAGGIFGAFVGPELVIFSKDLGRRIY